ncbi:MAG: hypothetical protein WDW36_004947 [Sanguina aurantia]
MGDHHFVQSPDFHPAAAGRGCRSFAGPSSIAAAAVHRSVSTSQPETLAESAAAAATAAAVCSGQFRFPPATEALQSDKAPAVQVNEKPHGTQDLRGSAEVAPPPPCLTRSVTNSCEQCRVDNGSSHAHPFISHAARAAAPPGLAGRYRNVCCTSNLSGLACLWGFSAIAVSLGSSYFQRIVASLPKLQSVADCNAESMPYAARLEPSHTPDTRPVDASCYNQSAATGTGSGGPQLCPRCGALGCAQLRILGDEQDCTLAVIQATCMVLASKVVDRAPSSSVLRDILQHLYRCSSVTPDQAYEVEARCLEALHWRLGPYYSEDPLTDESPPC